MEEATKTLSPYSFIKSDDPSVDQLPLKSTSADVKVVGVIADVIVTQAHLPHSGGHGKSNSYHLAQLQNIVITLADLKIISKAPLSPGGAFEPLIDFGLF